MSNHLAVATVTAAMRRLLEVPLTADVPGALVKVGRPDAIATAAAPTVNMYLYQVLPNGARRNDDLPSRRADGSLVERPRAAIDLSYLISFFGDEQELEPQRLLGSTVRTFTSRPLLGSELFDEVVVAAGATPPVYPALIESDLADAPEPVRLAPLPLDLDSLSKLWSVFFQTPHVLSIAWSASVVFLEESLVTTPSLPVVAPAIEVTPLRRPAIIAVAVRDAPAAPVTTDAVIRLTGRQLAGDVTTVRVAGVDLEPESATAQTVDVDLATALAGTLRAGPAVIEVVHRRLRGVPPTPRDIVTSPPFPVVLHPRITAASVAGGSLRLDCEPVVGARQVAVVELRGPGSPVAVRVLAVPEHDDVTTVAVPVAGVDAGSYDTVVVVDGAASTPRSVTVP